MHWKQRGRTQMAVRLDGGFRIHVFMDLRGRHVPAFQVRADTQAHVEMGAAAGQRLGLSIGG
jgi:hypothetical protein